MTHEKELLKKQKEELVKLLIEYETREKQLNKELIKSKHANCSLSLKLVAAGINLEIIEKRVKETREEYLFLS